MATNDAITFDEHLSKALKDAIAKNPQRVVDTLWAASYSVEQLARDKAQANFEHPSGNLPTSLHSEVDAHAFYAQVGTNLEYARLREFGGIVANAWGRGIEAHHIGRPYLVPALNERRARVIELFRKMCDDVVNDISREAS